MGDATLAAAGRELDLLRSFADRDPASSFAFRHVDHGHADVAVCAMTTGGTVGTSQYPLPWRITYRLRRSPQSRAVSSRAMEPQSRPPTTMLPLTPQAPANALDRLLRALGEGTDLAYAHVGADSTLPPDEKGHERDGPLLP